MRNLYFLTILTLFSLGCGTTQQLDLYNPYPDKQLILDGTNVSCTDSYERKLWYILYGNYQLNHINTRELFPVLDYTYKIEQVATVGDKILSIFTGLFLSVSRKTLVVKTCQSVAKLQKPEVAEPDEEEVSTPEKIDPKVDSKIEELEKEVSFLKGKISGIETTVGWMNSPSQHETKDSDTKQQAHHRGMGEESEDTTSKILSMQPKEVSRHSFLFKIGSSQIAKNDKAKIKSLKEIFQKPFSKILVIGSADSTGNFKNNLNLSWRRAEAVRNEITKLGIPKDRIIISGAGENKGRESSADESLRRVDIYLVQGGE
ncbi:MAG: OmpA family protein [Leptospiraceae bacterium]|nr:OmpA family protein [Leptospiraceae bacterium]MCK6382099.1 OmpA family protein [Leptospiraceae bacterium]NUM81270.1 OmpA family protein [bacterium]